MDPAKLKVVELRSELSKRGLDTKGNKAVLVERLRQALDDESGNEPSDRVDSSPEAENEREKTPEPPKPAKTPRSVRSTRHQELSQDPQDSPVPRTPTRGGTRSSARSVTPDKKPPVKSPVVEKAHELPTITETPGEDASPQKETSKKVQKKEESSSTAAAVEKTEKVVSPEKQEAHVSPVKSQEAKTSPTKLEVKTSPVKATQEVKTSPVKVSQEVKTSPAQELKASPVKAQEVKESPVKAQELKTSPSKPAQITVTPSKCTEVAKSTQEPSPAKPAQQSPVKSAPVVQSPIKPEQIKSTQAVQDSSKSEQAQSPVKSGPSPAKPPVVNPVKSPVASLAKPPVVSPAKPPVVSPAKPPVVSPAKPPVVSPAKPPVTSPAKLPVTSPVKPPVSSPAKPPVSSPAKPPVSSPAKPPVSSPAKPPVSSPAKPPVSSPAKPPVSSPAKPPVSSPAKPPVSSPAKPPVSSPAKPPVSSPAKPVTSPVKSESTVKTPVKSEQKSSEKLVSPKTEKQEHKKKIKASPAKEKADAIDENEDIEMKEDEEDPGCYAHLITSDDTMKNFDEEMDSSDKYDHLIDVKDKDESEKKDESKRDEVKSDRKRKRSPSPDEDSTKIAPKAEEEPELEPSAVTLSWYDSDLNLIIQKEGFLSATPMHNDGFGYVWAGARATYGFRKGKIFYEVKITENCQITLQDEENPHLLRAGWSVIGTSMQLGEEPLSFGFDATGKKSTNNEFSDYGESFNKDDIIGCYLDMNSDNIEISFTVNGNSMGPAFTIPKSDLGDKALYPHILTKNCTFVCNFGQEDPWGSNILENYVYVGKVDEKERIIGPQRPEKREDCEMLMLCGLPGSGKTYWSIKYAAENPDKMYNILGTNSLIEKMKVMGVPRKENNQGKWEVVIDKCSRALTKLVDIAARRRRNYILDQNNVYLTAQRRKMRHFQGFQRKAVVIVPSDEEFQTRTTKPEYVENKCNDSTVQEMKANFVAPTVGDSFNVVEYIELGEEEAKTLIEKYNKEAKDAGFGQQHEKKRSRFEKADHRDGRSSRDNRERDNRRSGYSDRNRNSSWRGGGGGGGGGSSGGGWRDRNQRGGHMRYGGPNNWRGRGGPGGPQHNRGDRRGGSDRRSSNDRNRSSSRSGGWGQVGYQGSQSSGSWGGQQGNWSGGQQSGWNQQGGSNWGGGQQQWGGNWKGYGQSSYGQSGYGTSNYGNGNWNSWNQQYYNQYWGQNQQSGQTTTASGQATNSSSVSSTKNTDDTY